MRVLVRARSRDAGRLARRAISPTHAVTAYRNGEHAGTGSGANVLGDPAIALTWLVNELSTLRRRDRGRAVRDDRHVRHPPVPIKPGDRFRADFGDLGAAQAHTPEGLGIRD